VKVLKKNRIPNVEYRTVHSFLALKEIHDYETGEISYEEDPMAKDDPPIEGMDVLIVDETSMLQDDLFNRIVPHMKKGLRVLFVGDPAQIPPVRGKKKAKPGQLVQGPDAIPFLHGERWLALVCRLTEIRRQAAGNPILEFVTEVRSDYKNGTFIPQHRMVDDKGISLVEHNSDAEMRLLRKTFTHPKFEEDADYMKVIAWDNETVRHYNSIVRGILYEHLGHIEDIVKGEKLITAGPYTVTAKNIVPNNEELKVLDVYTQSDTFYWTDDRHQQHEEVFKVYRLTCEMYINGDLREVQIPVVHESSKKAFSDLQNYFSDQALKNFGPIRKGMWKQYFRLRDKYARVQYNYAITAHKSQGSTYEQCLVLQWSIHKNYNIEERNRILYVACTRPSQTLYIELP
jgi:exodeoxyribonuclease-5